MRNRYAARLSVALLLALGIGCGSDREYYQADDAEALEEAFGAIAGEALACRFELESEPADPDDLEVNFDGEPVERDPDRENGWDYDEEEHAIEFFGDACDALGSGQVSDLAITQPCGVVIE